MGSSESTINKIASQNEFEQKSKQLKDALKIVAEDKEASAYLFKEYDTFLNYQSDCIKLCEFIIKWISEPEEFEFDYGALDRTKNTNPEFIKNYKCEYDQELRKLTLNKKNVYQLLSEYIQQIKLDKKNTQATNQPLLAQITFLENNSSNFKNALKNKTINDNAEFISLDLNILLLGYIRYCLNDGVKVNEEHLHHFVNREKKFDGGNLDLGKNNGLKIDRLKEITDSNFGKINAATKAGIFLSLLQKVADLNQFNFNSSNSGTNFKFFQRLTKAKKSILKELINLEDILKNQFNVSTQKDINTASSQEAWQWCKHDLLLSTAKLDKKKIYDKLKNSVEVGEDQRIYDDQIDICNLLNIKHQDLKNKESDDDCKAIKDKSDVGYFNQLVELAKASANHRSFLAKLKDKIDDSLEIKTKSNSKDNSAKSSNKFFNTALKIYKQKTIEQLLILKGDDGSTSLTPTIILGRYLVGARKREPFPELYIKYIDQLCGTQKNRYEGKVYPELEDLQIFTNKLQSPKVSSSSLAIKINSFVSVQDSLGDCVVRINYFLNGTTVDPLMSEIVDDVIDRFGVTQTQILDAIESGITSVNSTQELDAEQVINFKSLSNFVEKDNPIYSIAHDYVSLYSVNVFLRLLINIMLDSGVHNQKSLESLIEKSLNEELECSHRVAIHLEFINKVIAEKNKSKMLKSFEEFKHDQIQIAKIVSIFHLLNGEDDVSSSNIEKLIESYSKSYFEQKSNPETLIEFLKSPKKKITKSKELRLKVDNFHIEKLVEGGVFVLHEEFDSELENKGWDLKLIKVAISENGIVESVWRRMLSCSDDLLFTTLISSYLDAGKRTETYKGRGHYVSYITYRGYYNSFVKSVLDKGFSDWLFPHTDLHTEVLQKKLRALGNLQYLGDERFEIIIDGIGLPKKLGQGSFGTVYLCKDKLLETNVAIKLIPTWGDDERIRKKLITEASIMRRCQGDNIVTVYDLHKFKAGNFSFKDDSFEDEREFLIEDELFGIVMEYIDDAQTLSKFVNTEKFKEEYNSKQKLDLFIQICKGVEQAHNLIVPVIHGDIKPDNILIDRNGIPKLVDFGVSSYSGSYIGASSGQTYSSPNICEGGKATVQDDIHSLAMVFIYLLYPDVVRTLNKNSKDTELKAKLYLLITFICKKYNESRFQEHAEIYWDIDLEKKVPSELSCLANAAKAFVSYTYEKGDDKQFGWPLNYLLKALNPTPNNEYHSLSSFSFDIGCCIDFGEVSTTNTVKHGGYPLTKLSISQLPQRSLLNEINNSEFDIDRLKVFCRVALAEKPTKYSVLAKLPDEEAFVFHLPWNYMVYERRLIHEDYEPNKLLTKAIIDINKFGGGTSQYVELITKLFQAKEKPIVEFDNKPRLFKQKQPLINIERPKTVVLSNVFDPLVNLFNSLTASALGQSSFQWVKAVNALPPRDINHIKKCIESTSNEQELTNALLASSITLVKGQESSIAKYLKENSFIKKVVYGKGQMQDWELFVLLMELMPPEAYTKAVNHEIEIILASPEFTELLNEQAMFEQFMSENAEYRLYVKCFKQSPNGYLLM